MLFSSEFVEQVQFRAQILVFAQWRETLDSGHAYLAKNSQDTQILTKG